MKKRLQIDSGILEFLVLILLAMTMIFYLNGCTAEALQLAKDKASPENVDYWKIKSVESAVKQGNGEISVCVELSGRGEKTEPKLNTITLPLSGLSGNPDAIERLGLRPGERFFDNTIGYWFPYWYPMEKTRRGCKSVVPGTSSSISVLPVGNISVNNQNRYQLYTLLANLNKTQPFKERIYEVRFISDETDTEKEEETAKDEAPHDGAEGGNDILFIYWPSQTGLQNIQPILITGVYEDNSTRLYYLLVPLAFTGEVVAVTAVVATYIVVRSFLECPQCW